MYEHKLGHYQELNNDTLMPTDAQLGAVSNHDWWKYVKPQFDNLIWMYYSQRDIFLNPRFDIEDSDKCINNIIKTFSIFLISKDRQFDRMFNAIMADFNPLWNVDGVTGHIEEIYRTGTDTHKLSGTDSTSTTDTGDITKSGNETMVGSGTDTNTHSVKTFDDGSNWKESSKDALGKGSTDTHTYNNVKDTHNLAGSSSTTFGKQDLETRNMEDKTLWMDIRQGNIGVTRSDELVTKALELFQSEIYDFAKTVVNACVDQVSYAIY